MRDRTFRLAIVRCALPLVLIAASVATFMKRERARQWLDQRFFREEYDARKILLSLTGIDIASLSQTTYGGYRPARKGGVRLEVQQDGGMPIVHNYGHGGGGVALSWGSAHKVRKLLEQLGH